MTIDDFKALKGLEGCRVCISFVDGQEVVATLVSVTTDSDESCHLVYDKVEWSALPHADRSEVAYYSSGDELVNCSLAPEISS